MKEALWDHVTSAPANLLQRFPCFPNVLLKKNFDDRHHELILMEQEGLLEENRPPLAKDVPGLSAAPSQTLLSEVMKTVSQVKMSGGPFSELGQLVDILAPEQIATLARIGVEKLEQLFELGATALQELGFDLEALIKIGNFKEAKRRTSIYTPDSADEKMESNEIVSISNYQPICGESTHYMHISYRSILSLVRRILMVPLLLQLESNRHLPIRNY